MSARGLGLIAGLALIAACDREAKPPSRAATATGSPTSPAQRPAPAELKLVAPVAPATEPSAASASASPSSVLPASPRPNVAAPPAAGTAPPPAAASYQPKDECSALPGFAAFRDKLATAVRRRDGEALAALADPAVRLDFGGGAGSDELRQRLARRPDLWSELAELLPLGCAADGGLATLPWIFSRMPESADPLRNLLVMGEKVALRDKPSPTATTRAELSWALVEQVGEASDTAKPFTEVQTADGTRRGFIETGKLRGLLDYRVIAEPQAGGWAITAFIAGD